MSKVVPEPASARPVSHIHCLICDELMYYGLNKRIEVGRRAVFNCKCLNHIAINDECGECRKPVSFAQVFDFAITFRCTCGHTATVLVKDIEVTHKA